MQLMVVCTSVWRSSGSGLSTATGPLPGISRVPPSPWLEWQSSCSVLDPREADTTCERLDHATDRIGLRPSCPQHPVCHRNQQHGQDRCRDHSTDHGRREDARRLEMSAYDRAEAWYGDTLVVDSALEFEDAGFLASALIGSSLPSQGTRAAGVTQAASAPAMTIAANAPNKPRALKFTYEPSARCSRASDVRSDRCQHPPRAVDCSRAADRRRSASRFPYL